METNATNTKKKHPIWPWLVLLLSIVWIGGGTSAGMKWTGAALFAVMVIVLIVQRLPEKK